MWAKICANTNLDDCVAAVEAGADGVGFVFAPSSRRVTAERVAEIVRKLPAGVEKVGVFAAASPAEISYVVHQAGLTAVQIHDHFDAVAAGLVAESVGSKVKIIQTLAYPVDATNRAVVDGAFLHTLEAIAESPCVWAVLIDAAKSGTSGGLGVAFDWAHVGNLVGQAVSKAARKSVAPHVILAGGLRPENVCEAIANFGPWGVDVASGVEESPGKKNHERVAQFVHAAKNCEP